MSRVFVNLSVLFSLLTGCSPKEATAPGTSAVLQYPVLLANDRQFIVKDDLEKLTSSTVATGPNFIEFTLLDANGAQYSIVKAKAYDRKSALFDMGTSTFRVFLELKATGKPSLADAKRMVKQLAFARGEVRDAALASQKIYSAVSFRDLIEAARHSWEWR